MSEFDWSGLGTVERAPWVEWESVGNSFAGKIVGIRKQKFKNDKPDDLPTVVLDMETHGTGEPRSLSLGPVNLRQQVADIGPQVGDLLAVKYVGKEPSDKGSPMKIFEVKHRVGERPAVAPAPDDPFDTPPEPNLEDFGEEPF